MVSRGGNCCCCISTALTWVTQPLTQSYHTHNKLNEDPKGLTKIFHSFSHLFWRWSLTAFLPPEQLRDMPKGVIAPTAKSLFVRLLRMQTGPESQLKCRAMQLSISRVTNEPQHVLCLWWVLCKCKASVLNWSSDLLWKHFNFHILLTTGFKCFVLAPVNRGKRRDKPRGEAKHT